MENLEQAECASPKEDVLHKRGRHRKKQLYNTILQQMEFYFSDSNITKDRFLSQLIQENPYVDLSVFLKFNKIRKLTINLDDIKKALRKSKILEVSEDGQNVCRKTPVKVKENVDECTVYVENVKEDATHEWLTSVFSELGNVVYVSIPKYRQSRVNKGFAFIEFDTEKEARNAIEFFESIGCKMPSHLKPEELCSIATFEKDQEEPSAADDKKLSSKNEVKFEHAEDTTKKRKRSVENESNKHKRLRSDDELDIKEAEQVAAAETEDTGNEDGGKKKKKLKKEHKKKNDIKELGLQVLSKREWKKMRNHYLDLQRKKMKEFKIYLHNKRFGQKEYNSENKESENRENTEQSVIKQKDAESKLEFVPGIIVKIKLSEPCTEPSKLKQEIKSVAPDSVKYVDMSPLANCQEVYVRFKDASNAQEFCKQGGFGEKAILVGEAEEKYWEKIHSDRQVKFNKANKKQRGRDKLLKKAEQQMVKHTRFDEET